MDWVELAPPTRSASTAGMMKTSLPDAFLSLKCTKIRLWLGLCLDAQEGSCSVERSSQPLARWMESRFAARAGTKPSFGKVRLQAC